MSVGGVLLFISALLWFAVALQIKTFPTVEPVAHACLALGILLRDILRQVNQAASDTETGTRVSGGYGYQPLES